jgi:hypothetical protein
MLSSSAAHRGPLQRIDHDRASGLSQPCTALPVQLGYRNEPATPAALRREMWHAHNIEAAAEDCTWALTQVPAAKHCQCHFTVELDKYSCQLRSTYINRSHSNGSPAVCC